MTQRELAQKLNVTDKAVSKWERGLGFPDINTIEPLADALGVSVLEIMNSEKIPQKEIETGKADEALSAMLAVAGYRKKTERRNVLLCALAAVIIILLIFSGDSMGLLGFLFVCLPVLFAAAGIVLILTYFFLAKHLAHRKILLIVGCILLGICILVFAFFFLAGALGMGPVPD